MKREWLGYFLQASRATPRRCRRLDGRGNPHRGRNGVGGLLGRLGETDTSRDAAALSQRGSRDLLRLSGRRCPPQGGREGGKRKRRWARKYWRDLREFQKASLDRKARGDRSGLHGARSGEGPVLRRSGRRGPLEGNVVIVTVIVVPPFADTGGSEPPNKDEGVLEEFLLIKLEVNDKAETIPLELLGPRIGIGKSTNGITHSPRSRKGRWKVGKGTDVFTRDLRGCLPVIEREPESNTLLESYVTNKDRAIDGGRTRLGKGQGLDVDIGVGIGRIGKNSGSIGVDDGEQALDWKGRWRGRLWEGIGRRFSLCLCFRLLTSGSRDIGWLAR